MEQPSDRDLQYQGENPGAVKYGNFINYYQFNPANRRLSVFPLDLIQEQIQLIAVNKTVSVLDIGCNAGEISQEFYQILTKIFPDYKIRILGLDIDDQLICRANECNKFPENITFRCIDIMKMTEEEDEFIEDFIKGPKFTIGLCLSVTMWIHLNHNDDGLRNFLKKWSSSCKMFIIEPQHWKNYQKAARRMRVSGAGQVFPLLKELKWRSNVTEEIERYLQGNCEMKLIYKSPPTDWKRCISIFVE